MSVELSYLAATTLLTLLVRATWLLNKVQVRGVGAAADVPKGPKPLADWAQRLWIAHEDAIQNLVTFAILVIIVELSGLAEASTAFAAAVYFWARLLHVLAYVLVLRWVKTITFLFGFFSQLWFVWILFSKSA